MAQRWRFNPAPGWPDPGPGWRPPTGWQPDPRWPSAPAGWQIWIPEAQGSVAEPSSAPDAAALAGGLSRSGTVLRWGGLALVALILLLGFAAGFAGALLIVGLLVVAVAVTAWVRNGWRTFWLPGRRAAAVAAGVGVAALVGGSALASSAPNTGTRPAAHGSPSVAVSPAPASESAPAPSGLATQQAASNVPAPTGPRSQAARSATRGAATPGPGTAAAALAGLTVKGRAPKTGYSRAQFGSAWTDNTSAPDGHNGCDTRNDILRRDLRPVTVQAGTNGCRVLSGILKDPYTRKPIAFSRGLGTSSRVQIDHVVALSDAWQKGAQQWRPATRAAFANDPLNLLAADGPTNESKGEGDAATWLPPNTGFRCAYVARQISVKTKYQLAVTAAEREAMRGVLARCPTQPVVSRAAAVRDKTPHATVSTPTPPRRSASRSAPRPSTAPPAGSVYYPNCDAVRAAGKAPLLRGDPGYSRKLDRDGDGVACED